MLPSDFSKKPIAAGLLLALYGATALAQDATVDADEVTSSEDLEEVVVTGIRYSIKRSMDLKRSDEGVMDAITAEDMGAFPDTNLAESLQRITGVSIERERGEGKYVTVRGFGPAFNLGAAEWSSNADNRRRQSLF
jgi:outer membrane cobalamin receptor